MELVSLFNEQIDVLLAFIPQGENVIDVTFPFYWLDSALADEFCVKFCHEDICKSNCHFSTHGSIVPLQIVFAIELE